MGLDPSHLPQSLLRRMPKEDRKPLGAAGLTSAEAQAAADQRTERELQNDIANLLRQRDIYFVQSRMDRPTTNRTGLADFLIILHGGHVLAVEVKVAGGQFSEEQQKDYQTYFRQTGQIKHAVYSLPQFREVLEAYIASCPRPIVPKLPGEK